VFNSTLTNAPATHTHKHHSLLQHFLGWTIETQADVFDAATATLMDFRVPQINGDVCFVYVLPHSARTALVEFTVFGPQVWPHPQYRELLRNYINARLRVNTFAICEEEIGVIPMTDAPFEPQPSAHVFNIGTAGGCTKPSTGYTFLRIQQQAKAIASLIQKTGQPSAHHPTRQKRYGLFDSILLNVLAQQRRAGGGQRVFADLYSRNPAWLMFKFLDEATTLREDLRVMRSTHWPTFAAAALDVVRRRVL
jgi:lycopene beta-cyclase